MSRESDEKSGQEPVAVVKTPIRVWDEKTKFFRGKWANRSNPTDVETVRLCCNGEWMQWQRGVTVIVPEPYIANANDAIQVRYTQEPGKGRKVAGVVKRFIFEIDQAKPVATHEEFRAAFLSGSKKTREAVAMHGINIPVEQSIPQI